MKWTAKREYLLAEAAGRYVIQAAMAFSALNAEGWSALSDAERDRRLAEMRERVSPLPASQ